MARALRRALTALALLTAHAGYHAAPAAGACVPLVGGWECDFKNEDTHLGLTQPGWKMISDDAIDRLVADARSAIALYRASTKALGDGAIRGRLVAMEARVREALAGAIAELARTASNDPWYLKPYYVDLALCVPYWEVALGGNCPTTPELALDAERVRTLAELEGELVRLRLDPALRLGEAWGDLEGDLAALRERFARPEALGRGPDAAARLARHDERFAGYEAMLAGPRLTRERWQAERRAISATLNATLAETLGAAATLGGAQLETDIASLESLAGMGREALGRMQAMELSTMSAMHALEAWTKLTERMLRGGDLIALDMAAELHEESRLDVEDVRSLERLPGPGTIVGNEAGARRFR